MFDTTLQKKMILDKIFKFIIHLIAFFIAIYGQISGH